MQNLTELAKEINSDVRKKGFWNSMHNAIKLSEENSGIFTKDIKDAFIAQKLALVHTEVSEAVEALRKDGYESEEYGLFEKDSFADELADSIIRILDLCGELEIDIEKQIQWKLTKNKQREFMHGKNS